MHKKVLPGVLLLAVSNSGWGVDLSQYRIVDLTHQYNAETIYWPTSPARFEVTELYSGETPGGWFYSANSICTPEHGGTHLDAPIHFSATGISVEAIPVEQLIAAAVVIDISAKAQADPNYRLTREDVLEFETQNGRIEPGTIVLLRTDWSDRWPDTAAYLGDDTPGDASRLSFPSYGEEAGRLLVEERGIRLLGVDTASIDYGASQDFAVHRVAAGRNVGALENLTGLAELPATGSTLFALPMPIEGGSGGPVRVVALVPISPNDQN